MKEFESFLESYIGDENKNLFMEELATKQRKNILCKDIFVKAGNNSEKLFFDNLIKEISLYSKNRDLDVFPTILDSFVSKDYCAIVLKRINGKTIGVQRNGFCEGNLSEEDRYRIANAILKIKDIKIDFELNEDYSRKEKIEKYLAKISKFLDRELVEKIEENIDMIDTVECSKCISHGDLIPTNIMLDEGKIKFIDWEFISIKPESYDIAYFLMFSKENDATSIIKALNFSETLEREIYKDALVLSLKEINNWNKLFGKVDESLVNKMIDRWKNELKNNVKELKL